MQQEMIYVYKVYEEGSFSKAAEKLYMTQPALSISIQKIETEIGMPLFNRNCRPLKLTAAGEIYIDTIKKIMYLEKDRDQHLNDIRNLQTGTIRLGGSHYLNAYVLPKILAEFTHAYPGIKIEIVEAGSDVLADMLTERKLDMTFSCNPVFMRNFERYAVFEDHILLAVPSVHPINEHMKTCYLKPEDIILKKHLEKGCPSVNLRSFQELEYILLSEGNNLHDRALSMFHEAGLEPTIKLTLSQLVTAYHLAAANVAATFTSDRMVCDPSVPLYFYKIDSEQTTRVFYALLSDRTYIPRAIKMFIQHLLINS